MTPRLGLLGAVIALSLVPEEVSPGVESIAAKVNPPTTAVLAFTIAAPIAGKAGSKIANSPVGSVNIVGAAFA